MTFLTWFSYFFNISHIFHDFLNISWAKRRLRQRINDFLEQKSGIRNFHTLLGKQVLNSKFPYTSGQKSGFFNVMLAHVLILKHHLSIQNMILDHPQGGKLHEESFFNTLRAVRMTFWWVFDDSLKIFTIFKKYFRKIEKSKISKNHPHS